MKKEQAPVVITMRRIRKGDYVRIMPGVFVLQKQGEVARVTCVYRGYVYVAPALHGNTKFSPGSLERISARAAVEATK